MRRIKNSLKTRVLGHALNIPSPERLIIKKAKWFHGAQSPVLFMIDDLTNAWTEDKGRDVDGPDYDWGGKLFNKNGVFAFLNKNLLKHYPDIRTVFFTVVGEMHSFNKKNSFASARSINSDRESIDFFRSVGFSDMMEISYHGVHHGVPRERSEDYVQEWESFNTLEQGLDLIARGKKIYRSVFGIDPAGGKYGGYKSNHFSDKTIEESGFLWWCRDWTPRDTTGNIPDDLYELEFFGEQKKVVSIPSTISGRRWTKKQIGILLRKNQVISVQEHISPRRPDGKIQTPNIFNDIDKLKGLFAYLKDRNVWYATCSELAIYFIAYSESLLYDVKEDSFRIDYRGRAKDPLLTIYIDARCLCNKERPYLSMGLPGGQKLSGKHIISTGREYEFMVDIPVRNGRYSVTAVSGPETVLKAERKTGSEIKFNCPDMAGQVEIEKTGEGIFTLIRDNEQITPGKINRKGNIAFFCRDSSSDCSLVLMDQEEKISEISEVKS